MARKKKHVPWPLYVRVDQEDEGELYVMLSDDCGEQHAKSLHTTREDAEREAAFLAKMLGCEWGTNYPEDA